MEKAALPTSFGVFKPVGHTVIAFESAPLQKAAEVALLAQGFSAADLARYTPAEMVAQVDAQVQNASPLASVGQDLNLIKAHRALAENGCHFLVVHAPDGRTAALVDHVVHNMHATAAQRYGTFIVEELVQAADGNPQIFESPDRGLDLPAAASQQT